MSVRFKEVVERGGLPHEILQIVTLTQEVSDLYFFLDIILRILLGIDPVLY